MNRVTIIFCLLKELESKLFLKRDIFLLLKIFFCKTVYYVFLFAVYCMVTYLNISAGSQPPMGYYSIQSCTRSNIMDNIPRAISQYIFQHQVKIISFSITQTACAELAAKSLCQSFYLSSPFRLGYLSALKGSREKFARRWKYEE